MKIKRNLSTLLLLAGGISLTTVFISCTKVTSDPITDPSAEVTLKYAEIPENDLAERITVCIPGQLDAAEITTLMHMREEELLARDVYLYFKSLYTLPIFKNIANSENAHTNAVKKLIVKYNLTDPAANHQPGVFSDPGIQDLYNQLIDQGDASLVDALYVGATIEDLDIFDLQNHIANDVDNADILMVLNNLLNGSKNHIRAFNAQLTARGVTYIPQYITQAEFDDIIN
ncbi:MAG: DUF2202 domain-containing protein [Bacteroidales bacterium]